MLTVTPAARDYFSDLLVQQPDNTNLRLRVTDPGTPMADVELSDCGPADSQPNDHAVDCGTCRLLVEEGSANMLSGAMSDLESARMGGGVSIGGRGAQGGAPGGGAAGAELLARGLGT